ncbi:hypothetical protein JRO89_XS13G0195500 [Xanthoceras sorbifolium]|uniref:Serine/threonine-protein kinase ATM n=1 Tax=Xanthoceras sorbifolium TaxID=99658 RepID=A0ABQ8H974_9ROSI|nr:hypothetical protein JRO89_XS13G0195500 [Xanthoceras sorbifolium]
MATVTSRDVQDVVSKLSSDKARTREEGIKLLSTWLDGAAFCKFLGQNTAKLKPNEIPHSETWPFLIQLLTHCISLEISASKRRPPKITFAKTLRIVIQRAEETKFSGKLLPLVSVVKTLFSHVLDVLSNVPSFQSEYGIILRHLLGVKGYCFHMRKRIYCSLLLLYMEKVESSLKDKNSIQYNQKEEVFRCILTFHSLLENPPGDFPETLREGIVKGFVQIFSFVRDEGKISRKLIECINTFLIKDGPNLGCQSLEIHDAVQQFVYRCWLTTHDRSLKDALILYARLQLNLTRDAYDGSFLVEQLLDVVCKELDQSSLSSTAVSRSDATKDDKLGTLSSSQRGLVELAALVFYRACVHMTKAPAAEKRVRREHTADHLKEALMKGKWLWNAAFCCLIRNYCSRISKDLFMYWFEGICTSFERILNDANMGHTYDGLLWNLRSMQELSSVLLSDSRAGNPLMSSFTPNELAIDMELSDAWVTNIQQCDSCSSSYVHLYASMQVDAALVLLGNIISCDALNICVVPQDVWDLQLFKQMPSTADPYGTLALWDLDLSGLLCTSLHVIGLRRVLRLVSLVGIIGNFILIIDVSELNYCWWAWLGLILSARHEALIFKVAPTIPYLFSLVEGDHRDIFHLRKNLLRATLGYLNSKVIQYFSDLQDLWNELDLLFEEDSSCPEYSIKQRRKLEDERVYDFLAGLNRNPDEVRDQVVARALFSSPEEAFAEVCWEEVRRKAMLNDDSPISSALEGSALVSRSFSSHKRPNHDSQINKRAEGRVYPTHSGPDTAGNSGTLIPFSKEQIEHLCRLLNQASAAANFSSVFTVGSCSMASVHFLPFLHCYCLPFLAAAHFHPLFPHCSWAAHCLQILGAARFA